MNEAGKLRAQLNAAHEALDRVRAQRDLARGDSIRLATAIEDVMEFHDTCLCRHARRYLTMAVLTTAPTR